MNSVYSDTVYISRNIQVVLLFVRNMKKERCGEQRIALSLCIHRFYMRSVSGHTNNPGETPFQNQNTLLIQEEIAQVPILFQWVPVATKF